MLRIPIFDLTYFNNTTSKYKNVVFDLIKINSKTEQLDTNIKSCIQLPITFWYKNNLNHKTKLYFNLLQLKIINERPDKFSVENRTSLYYRGWLFDNFRSLMFGSTMLIINLLNLTKSDSYDATLGIFKNTYTTVLNTSIKCCLYFCFSSPMLLLMIRDFIKGNLTRHLVPGLFPFNFVYNRKN